MTRIAIRVRVPPGLLILAGLGIAAVAVAQPPVRTQAGLVQGTAENGITVYEGVPFASPPVGALRWRAPQLPQPWAGVTHGAEIAYVFGNPAQQAMHFTETDRALSEAVETYWTDFAKRGDPNGDGLPHWQPFTARHPDAMHFRDTPRMGGVPNVGQLEVLDAYYAWRRAQAHESR
ncbi:MAG: carboxylesterase family protein [Steroidobacteraceae bacterium]